MKKTFILLLVSLFISITAFSLLAISVKNGNAVHFNTETYNGIAKIINPALTNFLIVITTMGEWFIYVPIALLFLIIPRSRVKIGIPATIVLFVAGTLNSLLKDWFSVPRPNIHRLITETGFGFPSGHAMIGTAFIGICAYLFLPYAHKTPLKITIITISTIFMLFVGFSRIYLGVHNTTDVLGGYCAGFIILIIAILIIEIYRDKKEIKIVNYKKLPKKVAFS
ncbi:MAG: phosphatase PAP2 family protein [Bacillota bacterium]|nr:phosphatase PAP2 family protein [Bacillota bacterium]